MRASSRAGSITENHTIHVHNNALHSQSSLHPDSRYALEIQRDTGSNIRNYDILHISEIDGYQLQNMGARYADSKTLWRYCLGRERERGGQRREEKETSGGFKRE